MDRQTDSAESTLGPANETVPVDQDQMVPAEARGEIASTELPRLAAVGSPWSKPVRFIALGVIIVASLAYVLFGTVLARNVTFNMSSDIDPGAKNGIPRYSRETVMNIWRTMWDKAPDFGSVDATRTILLVATVSFFAAFAAIVLLVFVPAREEWSASLGDRQEPELPASE